MRTERSNAADNEDIGFAHFVCRGRRLCSRDAWHQKSLRPITSYAMNVLLEVCIDSLESAIAAKVGGADRLEVCSSLMAEGTTPSFGLVKQCVEQVQLPVMMMIRPHDGGFVYRDADIELMVRDIEIGHSLGIQGFVFGVLTEQRQIDAGQCRRLLQAVGSKESTFHRAFDVVPNPIEAFDELIALGFTRLLTSGQQSSAEAGSELIRRLINRAEGRIVVLPGAGINLQNAAVIAAQTGATELHSSASVACSGQRGEHVEFGTRRRVTDAEVVRSIKQSIANQ